jgi:hypothetical protein
MGFEMIKVVGLKDCSIYDEYFKDYEIKIQKNKLYYAYLLNDNQNYHIYHIDNANYIGIYPVNYFGPYEIFLANERNRKIDEILND